MASLNRLVVAPEARHQGLGRLFDIQRIALAYALGAKRMTLEAVGDQRCLQLSQLGFEIDSVHEHDPDFRFAQPRQLYPMLARTRPVPAAQLYAAYAALGIRIVRHDLELLAERLPRQAM